uniref:Terminase-like protein n=1 Tax=Clavibacter phage CN77 TaxID=686440 RepID=E9LS28_9VIRU|nr:terminase-like protein [Clavibacter phage CN77]
MRTGHESLEWKYKKMDGSGNEAIAFGKRPTDQDIVSTFQGTRKLRTFVALDEAGGVPPELFTGAEAVMTGQDSKIVAIGNPDSRGTEFHRIFTVPALMDEWNTFTISAYDLPTVTGEVVYPDHPEKQERMLKGLTSLDWIQHKERVWKVGGKPDGRFLAKVLGEFPGETDNAFFPQEAIDRGNDTTIDKPEKGIIMGVDLARMGDDDSVVYTNQGGRVRLFKGQVRYSDREGTKTTTGVWSKENTVASARRVHAIAMQIGAKQVRLDSSGIGGAVFDELEQLEEFDGKCYTLVGINNANSSSNNMRWANIRAENHDNLRDMLIKGYLDLDPEDTMLRDELLVITYKLNLRGAVQITPKDEMKSELNGSPDRLDAVIYSLADLDHIVDGPQPGERIEYDMGVFEEESPFYAADFW